MLSTVLQNCAVKGVGKDSLMSIRSGVAVLNTSLLLNWLQNFQSAILNMSLQINWLQNFHSHCKDLKLFTLQKKTNFPDAAVLWVMKLSCTIRKGGVCNPCQHLRLLIGMSVIYRYVY